MHRTQPTHTLFPYTTLFRSDAAHHPNARQYSAHFSETSGWVLRVVRVKMLSRPTDRKYAARGFRPNATKDADQRRHRRSEEHTSELQSHSDLVCRLLLEKKK